IGRLNSDGTLDSGSGADTTPGDSFGVAGFYIGSGIADGTSVIVQSDDKILALGATKWNTGGPPHSPLARILSARAGPDSRVGSGGLAQSDLTYGGTGIVVAPDGKIVAGAGYDPGYLAGINGRGYFAAARFQGDAGTAPQSAGALAASSGSYGIASRAVP